MYDFFRKDKINTSNIGLQLLAKQILVFEFLGLAKLRFFYHTLKLSDNDTTWKLVFET